RGDILDKHGQVLATLAEGTAITADPSEIVDPAGTAAKLCAALRDCSPSEKVDLIAKLSKKREFEHVRRWRAVNSEQLDRVRALDLPGIAFMAEPGRYYPGMTLAAHILGLVGLGNEGLGGLEKSYDDIVGGSR